MPDLPTGTVTFLFTDIEGSTALWERDPARMRELVARHDELLREAIAAHAGHVFKTVGDTFCAAFETAPDAVAAALRAQLALQAEDWGERGPLRVRIAVHAGAADVRNGDYGGPALNRVSRLLSAGHGSQTLLSQTVYELVRGSVPNGVTLRDLGSHSLKDLQQPMQVYQLVHPALPSEFPALRSLEALPNNLPPQLTSFIGREREMAEIKQILAGARLLTLTGAGGSGKTRLALQVAAELLEEYPDGVWLVELATLTDAALVPQRLASTLGIREQTGRPLAETLAEYLKTRKLLLIPDNCEHVIEACARLTTLILRACPGVKVHATSREPMAIAGETIWPVPALSTPDPHQLRSAGADRVAAVKQYESVRLLVDRAALSQLGYDVTEENALALAQICHRLDGIPLAIELAAARLKVLSPEEIAARLDDRFRLLTGGSRTAMPRHQTLRAAIDWSYELLSESERMLLRRLSVFPGGWTLQAAEAVCGAEGLEAGEVLELQTHLVDKSLVMVEHSVGGETRYRLLGTIRQYARDRLFEAGEAARLRSRHRDWFLALAERAAPELRGTDQALWFDRLEQEHENLRAALEWSQADPENVEAGLRLAGALYRFWYSRGYLTEGRQWLEGMLAAKGAAGPGPRARALHGGGFLAWAQADYKRARALLEESVALYRMLEDKRGLARTLNSFGLILKEQREDERSKAVYEEGLAVAREIGASDLVASLLNNLGEVARARGDYDRARAFYEEALTARLLAGVPLLNLGLVAFAQADYTGARSCFSESLAIAGRLGDKVRIATCLEGLAGVWAVQRQPERGARILGAAQALRKAIGVPVESGDRLDYERFVAGARAALNPAAFAAAWNEGAAIAMQQAIELARGEHSTPSTSRATGATEPRGTGSAMAERADA